MVLTLTDRSIDLLEEDPRWDGCAGGPDVGECVGLFVAGAADVAKLAAVEAALQEVVHVAVGDHVVVDRVALVHRLLDDEVGVSVYGEAGGTAGDGHLHAVDECLVLRFVVGGVLEVHAQDVAHLVSLR